MLIGLVMSEEMLIFVVGEMTQTAMHIRREKRTIKKGSSRIATPNVKQ